MRSPPRVARSTIGAGQTCRPPSARSSCSSSPSRSARNSEELALLESLDVGKPIRDTLAVDVPSAAKTIQWFAETIDKVYGEVGPTGPEALSLVTREPIGVVGAIVPWNYPLIVTAWKLGAALATGNSVVLKPASAVAADRPAAGRAGVGGRAPGRRAQRRPGPGRGARRGAGAASRRRQDRVHRLDRGRPVAAPGDRRDRRQGASRSSSAARARRSCWPTSATSRRRRRPSAGGSSTTAARPVTRARGWSSIDRSARSSSSGSPTSAGSSPPASRSTRRRGSGSIVDARQLDKVLGYVELGQRGGRAVVAGGAARPRGQRRLLRPADDPRRRRQRLAGGARGDLRPGPDRDRVRRRGGGAARSPTTRRTGWRPASGRATSTRAHRLARALRAGTVCVNTFDTADITVPFGGFKQSGLRARQVAPRARRLHPAQDDLDRPVGG